MFSEKYPALERKFRDRVAQDKECFGLESLFLPNIAPQDPVDFVLIGMEPSIGGEGASILDVARKKIKRGFKNFARSTEDFILHFCIKEYLCVGWGTYYLTDLSKGRCQSGLPSPSVRKGTRNGIRFCLMSLNWSRVRKQRQ